MNTDLTMLVASAMLCATLPVLYLVGRLQVAGGLDWGLGNRDTELFAPAWVGRAERAHRNLLENLPHFAVVVLAAQLAGQANAVTAIGATVFFWARIAHVAVYVAGITRVRTAVYFLGLTGELVVLSQLW